jgi:hypothetical protein
LNRIILEISDFSIFKHWSKRLFNHRQMPF